MPRSLTHLALAPDGRTVATADHESVISIWDATTQRHRKQWSAVWGKLNGLVFSADDKTLISLYDASATAHLWDVTTGELVRRAKAPKDSIGCAITPDGCSALTPDARRCAIVTADDDGVVQCTQWDVASGRELQRIALASEFPFKVTYSPDGRLRASLVLRQDPLRLAIADVVCWDAITGKQCMRVEQSAGVLGSLAFASDSRRLAFGRDDGTIQILDVLTAKSLGSIDGHRGSVMAMQCSPDGKTLYSASMDTTVLLWDLTRWPLPRSALSPAALDAAWADLASREAAKALRAVGALARAPNQAVPFLAGRLKPIAAPDPQQVRRWIADLGSDDFRYAPGRHEGARTARRTD